MDLGALSVQLETNLKRFSADMRKSVEVVDHSCTEIQKSVEEETKTTTELRDRFFKATHNNLQNDLYSHDQYFNNLRDKWADNESMLTQINITANAEREKILKDYANSANNMMSKLQKIFRMGFLTYGINSLLDMGTAMAKAKVNGESMFRAFISGLPIINRMADSAEKFGDALADLYLMGQISTTPAFNQFNEQYKETFASMKLELDLLRSGGVETAEIIESQYQQQIKDINAKKEGTKELIQYQENLNKKIAALQAERTMPLGVGFGGVGRTKSVEQIDKEIAALKEKQETYSTTAQKENLLLLAAQTRDEKLAALTEKQTEDTIQSQNEITNATIRMYQDLGQYPQEYFDLQEELLKKQVKAYTDAGGDWFLAEKWKANEMKRIADDVAEYKKQKQYSDALSGDDFGAGFSAEVSKMYDEMETLGELGANLGRTMKEGLVNSLNDAILEAKSLNDALREVGLSMARMAMQWAMNQTVTSGLNAAFGVAASDKGNIFNSGDIVPFVLGGVVNRPAMFSMPNGRLGSIAEVAPEAIMPLKRTSGGRLGVETSGGQSNYQPQIKVVIVRNEQEAFEEYLNSARGEKTLLKKQAKNQKYFN